MDKIPNIPEVALPDDSDDQGCRVPSAQRVHQRGHGPFYRWVLGLMVSMLTFLFLIPTSLAQENQAVEITDRGTVRMHVANEPLSSVLHLLSLEGERNIVSSPNVSGTVTANLYDVSFSEALKAILIPNGADFRIDGKFVYVYTKDELLELSNALAPSPETKVYRLNYVSANEAETYIKPVLGEGEQMTTSPVAASGLASEPEGGGGLSSAAQEMIVVRARKKTHEEIRRLLKEIDVRPKQVLVEATILRAELSDENALGIDFTLVGGVDLELLSGMSAGLTELTLGSLPQNRLERFNGIASTDFSSNISSGGLTIGIIKDHVAVFVRALEEITNTTVLANPKILTLNRQKGQVIVGRRDGFLTTTVTETQAIQTVQFLETGTQLIFRPFIGDDGYIRVELHPEDSVGFVNAQGLPSEQTTEVTTNVIIRDGQTILIGGLFREVTTDAQSQVPGLGSMPWLGGLFRSTKEDTTREEVIILLTIHIVKDDEAYAEESRAIFEDLERLRVGVRQGLMKHGRERLAQRNYQTALKRFNQGDRDLALWHVKMALHNYPRFLEAIKFKEQLTQTRDWDVDGSVGRNFLHRLMARERGYDLSPFGRSTPGDAPRESSSQPHGHGSFDQENQDER